MSLDDTRRLRFRFSTEVAQRLVRNRIVSGYQKGNAVRTAHADTYFDTPRLALRQSGVRLRVSGTDSERVQEVRAPVGEAGFRVWTTAIGREGPGFGQLDSFPERLLRRGWESSLEPVFSTHVERTTLRLEKGGCSIDLALDAGHLQAERQDRSALSEGICDAGLTLVAGDPTEFIDVALELIESVDLTLSHQSVADRGYALLRPSLRRKSRKAERISLEREMTVGEAFLTSAQAALAHLFANEAPTLDGRPGGIHQSRVAIRRQRAALRAFKGGLPYGGRKAFNYEFRWFQQRMGPARDWHVLLDETIPQMVEDGVSQTLVEKLQRVARDRRRRASRDAVGHLTSRRFTRLQLQFERWLTLLARQDPAEGLQKKLEPFAHAVLDKTHRYLLIDTRPLARMSSIDLHALRIRGKKSRYAGEFFQALYPGEHTERQLMLLSEFQDHLGEANDASVARQLLATLNPRQLTPETVMAVNEWAHKRILSCTRQAQPQWRQLQKLEPFWRAGAGGA